MPALVGSSTWFCGEIFSDLNSSIICGRDPWAIPTSLFLKSGFPSISLFRFFRREVGFTLLILTPMFLKKIWRSETTLWYTSGTLVHHIQILLSTYLYLKLQVHFKVWHWINLWQQPEYRHSPWIRRLICNTALAWFQNLKYHNLEASLQSYKNLVLWIIPRKPLQWTEG